MNRRRVLLAVAVASVAAAGSASAQAKPPSPLRSRTIAEDLQMLTGVLNMIRVNHPDSMDSHRLIMAAIRGMVSAADPHSYVIMYQPLVEERAKALESGKAAPIPIGFRFVGGAPVVVTVAPGSAAARGDILPGDELVAVDGGPVTAESAEELEILLAGPKGSAVKLTFERQRSDGGRVSVMREVKRERTDEQPAVPTSFMLDDSTGYVRVITFASEKAADELRAAVGRLEGQKMRRLMIDLRDNGGGSVDEAADVAGLFYEDLIGRTELLESAPAVDHWKARGVDLSLLLAAPDAPPDAPRRRVRPQISPLPRRAGLGPDRGGSRGDRPSQAGHRAVRGTQREPHGRRAALALDRQGPRRGRACRRRRSASTSEGSAGQSFGAWLAPGVELSLTGDANDYVGQGAVGRRALRPAAGLVRDVRGPRRT